MTDVLYENRPGGTIVRLRDGTGHPVRYGDAYVGDLDPSQLDPEQAADLGRHADGTPRVSATDQRLAQAREAHQRAALDEGGQVNSSQSPVPGNYGELDEDGAANLMRMMERHPEQQASVVMHEMLYGGARTKVVDAASEYARVAARSRIGALTAQQMPNADPTSLGAPPVASPGDPGFKDETGLAPSARPGHDQRVAAALGLDAMKRAEGKAEDGPSAGALEAQATAAGASDDALRQIARGQESLANMIGALAERLGTLEQERHTPEDQISPDAGGPGGDALGWDGKDGANTEGYWTNQELKDYASRQEIDLTGASTRDQIKSKLALAGHDSPQTPKP